MKIKKIKEDSLKLFPAAVLKVEDIQIKQTTTKNNNRIVEQNNNNNNSTLLITQPQNIKHPMDRTHQAFSYSIYIGCQGITMQ